MQMPGTDMPPITLTDIGYAIDGRAILSGVTLGSGAARIGIVGRNGSGKSTLARLLAGLLTPTSGSLSIEGIDPATDRKAALATIGILFQNPEHQIIFPRVSEEIAFGLRQKGLDKKAAAARVTEVLGQFDRSHWQDALVQALSQGQKHLLCIMAVLAMRPRVLVMDEPFAGLDIPTRRQLTRHLSRADARLIHISHDPEDLTDYDEVFWIDHGRLVTHGPATEVLPAFTREMHRLGERDDLADLAH